MINNHLILFCLSVLAATTVGCSSTKVQPRHHSILTPLSTQVATDTLSGILDAQEQERLYVRALSGLFAGDERQTRDAISTLNAGGHTPAGVYLLLADRSLEAGDASAALLYAETAHQLAPGNVQTTLQYATLLADRGDLDGAVIILSDAEQVTSNPADARHLRLQIVRFYEAANRPDDALLTLEPILETDPFHPGLQTKAVELLGVSENPGQHVQILEKLASENPANLGVRKLLANSYQHAGDSALARVAVQNLLKDAPHDPDVQRLAAFSPGSTDLRPETPASGTSLRITHSDVETALRQANPDRKVLFEIADTIQDGQPDLPPGTDHNAYLGRVLAALGIHNRAADLLMASVDSNPRDKELWRLVIFSLTQSGRYAEASALGEESLLLFPSDPELTLVFSEALVEDGNCGVAENRLQRLLSLQNEHEVSRLNNSGVLRYLLIRSSACSETSMLQEPDLLASRALEPADCGQLWQKANMFVSLGEPLAAERLLDTNAALCSGQLDQQVLLAQTEHLVGRNESALQRLEALMGDLPAPSSAYILLGDLLAESGDPDRAATWWLEGLNNDPDHPMLRLRLGEQD